MINSINLEFNHSNCQDNVTNNVTVRDAVRFNDLLCWLDDVRKWCGADCCKPLLWQDNKVHSLGCAVVSRYAGLTNVMVLMGVVGWIWGREYWLKWQSSDFKKPCVLSWRPFLFPVYQKSSQFYLLTLKAPLSGQATIVWVRHETDWDLGTLQVWKARREIIAGQFSVSWI